MQYFYLQFAIPLPIVVYLFIKITDTMAKQGKSSKNNTAELAQQQQQPGAARPPQDLKVSNESLVF